MGTLTGQSIVDKARYILQDSSAVRWLDAEALAWINEGQRFVTLHRPDASAATGNITLVAGTKQLLPLTALRLLEIVRNMGVGGATPGEPIRLIDRGILDAQIATWHSMAASAAIKHYIYDNRNPKVFYVYPPALVDTQIEGAWTVVPAALASLAATITLDDIYEPVLVDYMIYRCQLKEAEFAGDPNRATMHLNILLAALGVKTKVDVTMSPNKNKTPSRTDSQGDAR